MNPTSIDPKSAPETGYTTRTQKLAGTGVARRLASRTALTPQIARPRCEVAAVAKRDGTRLRPQRTYLSAHRRDSHVTFAKQAELLPPIGVLRARRKHQQYVAIEAPRGDYIPSSCGRLAAPNWNARRQRANAISDLTVGPFLGPGGSESGTDFGARFRNQNGAAVAQVRRA